jgi:WD40 repeat protein
VDEVGRCHAIGYPWFAQRPDPDTTRETVDAIGVVPVLSGLAGGLLSLTVTVAPPQPLPGADVALSDSPWAGMSGAPVLAGDRLLGVVAEHARRAGQSAITVVPLTALEADPQHPGWGVGVPDPPGWWRHLGADGRAALRRLPEQPTGAARPEYLATVAEIGGALHRRMPQLHGRDRELAELAAFATGRDGYRWLVGGAYAGKTALVYEAVSAALPGTVDVVVYFLSRPRRNDDSNQFFSGVVPQLAHLCGVETPIPGPDEFNALWQQAAQRAAEQDRHLLLVVDGLDEDLRPEGTPSVASRLPSLVGAHAHVLVSSRPYPELPADIPPGHPLTDPGAQVSLEPFPGSHELAELARAEIDQLAHGADSDVAVDVVGLLAAAAGPLSVTDLATLAAEDLAEPSLARRRRIRRVVAERAERSLEPVGNVANPRYQFAHPMLLEHAQQHVDLSDPEYRQRIDRWADRWRAAGWPAVADGEDGTPRYLLDSYAATLARQPDRLAALTGDVGWVDAAIRAIGVDRVLAILRTAANVTADPVLAAMLAVLTGQAPNLRSPGPVERPGFAARQVWVQATEFGLNDLAEAARGRTRVVAPSDPVPLWTTRRAARGFGLEIGRHDKVVSYLAVLDDGRVVSGSQENGQVLVCDPAGAAPIEVGWHYRLNALAALGGGRFITGERRSVKVWDPAAAPGSPPVAGYTFDVDDDAEVSAVAALGGGQIVSRADGRLWLWDPADPGTPPVELGEDSVEALAAFGDNRVLSGDYHERMLSDAAAPDAAPVELGHHGRTFAAAVLGDGRVVTGGEDGRVLLWGPGAPPVTLGSDDGWVMAVTVLRDGRVASGDTEGRVRLWNPGAVGAAPIELGRCRRGVRAVAALADGRVVSGGYDGRVLVWDPAAAVPTPVENVRRDDSAAAVAVLADGRVLSVGKDGSVRIWDPAAGPDATPIDLGHHDDPSIAQYGIAVVLLDDQRLITGSLDGRRLLWDLAAPGAAPAELGDQGAGLGLAALGDGRVVDKSRTDNRLVIWDPAGAAGAAPLELGNYVGSADNIAVLPDGRIVSGGSQGVLRLWNSATPNAQPIELGWTSGAISRLAVLGNGRVVSGDSGGGVQLWDPTTPGAAPVELGHHDRWVTALAVLADGRVFSGGYEARVRLWDPATPGVVHAEIDCSVGALSARAIPSAQATLLVIADADAGLSIWTVGAPG